MQNIFNSLNEEKQKEIINQFSYDYFFHYLLYHSDQTRLFLCRYLSNDESIISTEIVSSEIYGRHAKSKKLVLDVVVRDNKGRLYNFEMQNYDFNESEEIRIMQYVEGLIQRQLNRGIDYDELKEVFQMIIYTGKPYGDFQSYVHDIQKGDIERKLKYSGDLGTTKMFQLRKLEEEKKMEVSLSPIDQFMHLLYYNDIEITEETDENIKEVIRVHNDYLLDFKAQIRAMEIERERMTYRSRLKHAKRSGKEEGLEEGKKLELLNNVKFIIENIYHTKEYDWLDDCTYGQLQQALTLAFKGYSYEEFIKQVKE